MSRFFFGKIKIIKLTGIKNKLFRNVKLCFKSYKIRYAGFDLGKKGNLA
jgi:hypothetical protein